MAEINPQILLTSHLLKGGCDEIVLVNAHRIKQVPGRKTRYEDLGADHFDTRHKNQLATQLLRRLGKLGFRVIIETAA